MVNFNEALTTAVNKVVDFSKNKINKNVITNLYTSRSLECTVTAGPEWENCTAIIKLCGNKLSIYFDAERQSFLFGGNNIADEVICTLSIDTKGLIKEFWDATGVSASAGGIATFYTADSTVVDNILTVNIYLSAVHSALSASNGFFENMVTLNPDALYSDIAVTTEEEV